MRSLGVVGIAVWAVLCFACGGAKPSVGPADAGGGDGGGGFAFDLPSISYTVDAGAPISSPAHTWSFVPVPEAHCANGTSTGIAVNLSPGSRELLVAIAGGGGCWEAAACAAGTAVHVTDTMGEAAVLAEAQGANLNVLFDRTDPLNVFRDASFVYIAYCTGDLHSGTRPHTYDWFGPRVLEHVGANNMDAFLTRLQPTFRGVDKVFLSGFSAGGFGATFNWWRFQKALPWARVDLLNDSGLMIDPAADGRYGTMQANWGMSFPPGCPDCQAHLSSVLSYSTQLLPAPRRAALLGYLQDNVIGSYWGLSASQIQTGLQTLKAGAAPNLKTYYLTGTQHVVLATPAVATAGGLGVREWLARLASEDASWDHAGP